MGKTAAMAIWAWGIEAAGGIAGGRGTFRAMFAPHDHAAVLDQIEGGRAGVGHSFRQPHSGLSTIQRHRLFHHQTPL